MKIKVRIWRTYVIHGSIKRISYLLMLNETHIAPLPTPNFMELVESESLHNNQSDNFVIFSSAGNYATHSNFNNFCSVGEPGLEFGELFMNRGVKNWMHSR